MILQLEENEEFVVGFWGCVLGGFVPVPIAVSPTYSEVNGVVSKLYNAWKLLDKPLIITSAGLRGAISGLSNLLEMDGLRIETIEELRASERDGEWHQASPDEMVLFQLTSGSTGVPKCVTLSHRNVIHQIRASIQLNGHTADDIALNWMPMDHVGSLICYHMRDVYLGSKQIFAKPETVIERPLNWLDWIEEYGVTQTWGPNFAFKLLIEEISKGNDRKWDLSSLKFIMNGGEQVSLQVARTFLNLFAQHGLNPDVMHPAYGMAELSSACVYSHAFDLERGTGVNFVDKNSLGTQIRRVNTDHEDAITFVEVGVPIPGFSMRIVDGDNQLLSESTIGRLQFKGPNVTSGYYNNDEANGEVFCDDGWFNTGDLGFIFDGRLTITGREKDMIILNGSNYYNHEIEACVEEVKGVEPTFAAACSTLDATAEVEKLAIFFTPTSDDPAENAHVSDEIRSAVARKIAISPDYIIPVEKEKFPKTTSGKIQRAQLRKMLEAGGFDDALTALDLSLRNHYTLPDWCFLLSWFPRPLRYLSPLLPPPCSLLLFCDRSGLAARLSLLLSPLGFHCILVQAGSDFSRPAPSHFIINPLDSLHYHRLCESLAADSARPSIVLHLWTYDLPPAAPASSDELRRAQRDGLFSLLWLVQALASSTAPATVGSQPVAATVESEPAPVQLYFISRHAQASRPRTLLAPQHATVPGLLKSLSAELPWLRVRHLDLETEAVEASADTVLREMRAVKGEAEVSYRGGERLAPRLERLRMSAEPCVREAFAPGALYLMTGGLGGVGSYLAAELMRRYGVRLLLVGRRRIPEREGWEAEAARGGEGAKLVKRVKELEQSGGEWMYRVADVCDGAALRAAVREAEAEYGERLRGVLHLAGEEGVEKHWREMDEHWAVKQSEERMEEALRAKVYGTREVYELVREYGGECEVVLFGSVNGIFGAATYGGYAAANSYQEGASVYEREAGGVGESRNYSWTVWGGRGMSEGMGEYVREVVEGRGYEVMREEEGLWSLIGMQRRGQQNVIVGLNPSNPLVKR
ncbi:MAG TPA: SDR family NAD(P)-dependent oxidoreductase, partial [Pyrinomonadaceae bacterium]|nr:SDR family NAD(P)-dependent oxidoreductase [Pyrinomonadaceae bacterium]